MNGPPHIQALKTYLAVFAAVLVLTGLTTWVARFDLGPLNTLLAITIACAQVSLVALYFMHLRSSEKPFWILAAAGLLWLLILVAFTMSDVLTRPILPPWE